MLSHSTFYISRKAIQKNHNIWWSFYDANEEKHFAAMHHIDKYLVMRIHEVILPISPPLAAAAPTALPPHAPPQYAIVPIPQKPELDPVDPYLASLLRTKKLELDNKHMAVRLKRCRKGQPPNPDWEQTWANYKATVLQKLVAEYQPPIGTATIASSPQQPPSPNGTISAGPQFISPA